MTVCKTRKGFGLSAKFLSEKLLTREIARVIGGRKVRCAVAYWGNGAMEHLFAPAGLPIDAEIICDLLSGSTNPAELVKMGAPRNPNLRHAADFHAKVYISDRGAVICSANASQNGIGFDQPAGLVEAGIFVQPDTEAYAEASAWFGRTWGSANVVDEDALEKAETAWNNRPRGRGTRLKLAISPNAPSLLGAVIDDQGSFEDIGFVFTVSEAKLGEREAAVDALERDDNAREDRLISPEERRRLRNWNQDDLYTGWSKQDVGVWPLHFVGIHRYRGKLTYSFYKRAQVTSITPTAERCGVVFGERLEWLSTLAGQLHTAEAMLETDAVLLDRLFAYCKQQDRWLYKDSERLIEMIRNVVGA